MAREEPTERALRALSAEIIRCRRCPRLVAWREAVARKRRAAYRDWTYWGKPVPGFGDLAARLIVVGLAPAAHGGNRTGRVFTGDPSAQFLMGGLCRAGFANQPSSLHRDDGLKLRDAYILAAVRCVPPDNRPTPEEFVQCAPFLVREVRLLRKARIILALGQQAYTAVLRFARSDWGAPRRSPKFFHGQRVGFGEDRPVLLASYHPSPRNTQTGKLTPEMFDKLLEMVRRELGAERGDTHGGSSSNSHLRQGSNSTRPSWNPVMYN